MPDVESRTRYRDAVMGGPDESVRLVVDQLRRGVLDHRKIELSALVAKDKIAAAVVDVDLNAPIDWDRVRHLCSPEQLGYVHEPSGIRMIYVPPGTALLGSDPGDRGSYEDERPQMQVVFVAPFYMAERPITNRQWQTVMEENELRGAADLPVVAVSWYDCQKFCEKAGLRLPTEDEWEYSARGTDGRIYPWGDSPPPKVRRPGWDGPPGPFGHLGLSGDVWQWCLDTWRSTRHPGGAISPRPAVVGRRDRNCPDPTGLTGAVAGTTPPGSAAPPTATGTTPASGAASWASAPPGNSYPCACYGGDWDSTPRNCRSALRNYYVSYLGFCNLGFRTVAEALPC